MTKLKTRILTLLLTFILTAAMIPSEAFADGDAIPGADGPDIEAVQGAATFPDGSASDGSGDEILPDPSAVSSDPAGPGPVYDELGDPYDETGDSDADPGDPKMPYGEPDGQEPANEDLSEEDSANDDVPKPDPEDQMETVSGSESGETLIVPDAVEDVPEEEILPPPDGYIDPGYTFGYTEGVGEAPLSEEVLNSAASTYSAYTLCDAINYFPDVSGHQFYWPTRNCVSSVKDQGKEGLCWSFACIGAVESALLYSSQESDPSSIDLSEVQAAYYTQYRNQSSQPAGCEDDSVYLKSGYRFGDIGGNAYQFVSSVTRRVGMINESSAPYSMMNSGLTSALTGGSLAKSGARYYIRNVDVVLGSDKAKIKALMLQNGALSCSVNFANYDYYDSTHHSLNCTSSSLNTTHAGVIVGWDDNYSRNNFKYRPSSNGAWLIKNSWGSSANNHGYYWLSYEDVPFCKANVFSYQCVAPSQDTAKIYQHDGGLYNAFQYYSNNGYWANVFKAAANEALTSVSFYTREDELDYQVMVYTNVTNGPSSGILVSSSTTSGHCTYAGYHTVTLRKAADLIRNEKFAVVIKLTDPYNRGRVSMLYEANSDPDDKVYCSVSNQAGESYYSSNGSSWTDWSTRDSGNYRIKAFTNNDYLVTRRLAGSDRYATMSLIAAQAFPNGASEVLMVTGAKFPDALAAAALAGAKKCPLLITPTSSLNASVKDLLVSKWSKKVKKVTFIGKGFSSSVISTLKNECKVTTCDTTTFAGADRYDTACRICEYGLKNNYFSQDACIVATGAKAADALSMSPWAYYYKIPILLVNSKGVMTSKTTSLLRKFNKAYAAGGLNVVPENVLYGNVSEIVRLAGKTRYETSVKIADYFVPAYTGNDGRPKHSNHFNQQVIFAPGADKNFPDALVGAMLGGRTYNYSAPGPIILVSASSIDSSVEQFVSRYRPSSYDPLCVFYLGAVTKQNENDLNAIFNDLLS